MKIRNPNLQMIMESHIRQWFIKEKLEQTTRQDRRPLILISRQGGAGGLSVAERLSGKLGWPYYDKNIIKEIADTVGAHERHLEFLDERGRNTFHEFLNVFRRDPSVSQDEYVQYLKRFIKNLGKVGGSIIVGRGANFILPPQHALRIRLIGEPEVCAQLVAQRYGMRKQEEAVKLQRKLEQEQRNFVERYYGEDVADPRHYDLVINITHLDLNDAVEIIILAYRRRFPGVLRLR